MPRWARSCGMGAIIVCCLHGSMYGILVAWLAVRNTGWIAGVLLWGGGEAILHVVIVGEIEEV